MLRVYDTRGGYATQTFTIDVQGGNRAPTLDLPPTQRLREGQSLHAARQRLRPRRAGAVLPRRQPAAGLALRQRHRHLRVDAGLRRRGRVPRRRVHRQRRHEHRARVRSRSSSTRSTRRRCCRGSPTGPCGRATRRVHGARRRRRPAAARRTRSSTRRPGMTHRSEHRRRPLDARVRQHAELYRPLPRERRPADGGALGDVHRPQRQRRAGLRPVRERVRARERDARPADLRVRRRQPALPAADPPRRRHAHCAGRPAAVGDARRRTRSRPARRSTLRPGIFSWTPTFAQAGHVHAALHRHGRRRRHRDAADDDDDGARRGAEREPAAGHPGDHRSDGDQGRASSSCPSRSPTRTAIRSRVVGEASRSRGCRCSSARAAVRLTCRPANGTGDPDRDAGSTATAATTSSRSPRPTTATAAARSRRSRRAAPSSSRCSRPPSRRCWRRSVTKVAVIGQPLQFTVRASDLDQDPLVFSRPEPAGRRRRSSPGRPTAPPSSPGRRRPPTPARAAITFTVTDSTGGSDTPDDRRRRARNELGADPPAGRQPDGGRGRAARRRSSKAIDADGDALTWSATGLPAGAQLDPVSGRLRWQTNYLSAGTYPGIKLTASDGAASSTETIGITVTQTDQAPIFSTLPPLFTSEQHQLQFTLTATDPDGDAVIYAPATPLPQGAEFDVSNGRFTWTPSYDQAGDYTLGFTATDPSGLSDSLSVHVTCLRRQPRADALVHEPPGRRRRHAAVRDRRQRPRRRRHGALLRARPARRRDARSGDRCVQLDAGPGPDRRLSRHGRRHRRQEHGRARARAARERAARRAGAGDRSDAELPGLHRSAGRDHRARRRVLGGRVAHA